MKQSDLIEQLIAKSKALEVEALKLQKLELSQLTHRPSSEKWTILEIVEHVNYYIEFYNQEFNQVLKKADSLNSNVDLKRSFMGNYFIEMMEPKEVGIKKMKTFKSKNPKGKVLNISVIQRFIELNSETIRLLENSKNKHIKSSTCKLTIPLIKLNLADAFQFLIAHNQRHFVQIKNNL
ncbi:MAG: DinB family protein [Flavobacteriales bacterium]|nr:DinB family protein [Flavobacteriales bacterium]